MASAAGKTSSGSSGSKTSGSSGSTSGKSSGSVSYDKNQDYQALIDQAAAGQIGAEKAQEMQAKLLDIMIKAKADLKNQAKEIVDEQIGRAHV